MILLDLEMLNLPVGGVAISTLELVYNFKWSNNMILLQQLL